MNRFVRARLGLAAALAGASTMIVELAAVRLIAPYFGASMVVWSNVIGVVLFALALGYLLGARLARGERPARSLTGALAFAALACAWLPFLSTSACRAFLPEGLALHEAFRLVSWGSLAATAVLFLPTALALGTASPLLAEAWQRASPGSAGAIGGRVLGASTLGGLVGVFVTPHFLVPELGLRTTYWIAATLLVLAAVCASFEMGFEPRFGVRSLAWVGAVASAFVTVAEPTTSVGWVELERRESPYQRVRVVEDRSGAERMRLLQVNEGLDSFQSVWLARKGLIGEGYYYDAFALPAAWSKPTGTWRLCVLGLGAGTAFRVIEGTLPTGVQLDALGVEIDPVVTELGRRWFELVEDAQHRVVSGVDARTVVRTNPGPFDQVVLDAYANQVEIPAHLSTVEFFELLHDTLAPGGWLSVNVGAFGCDDPLVIALAETIEVAFEGSVLAVRIPASRNVVLFARRDARPPRPDAPGWRAGEPFDSDLLAKTTHPANWRWFEGAKRAPLDDDSNPIDRLQLESLELGRARLSTLR
ncbi:MAG: fused MFS/spermidine synthase [Planctomycetes bacterium]|nr:fused MFS/spermidine synthase [Planctomycetota bacterium]